MYCADGTCMCCFLQCRPEYSSAGHVHYPCDAETRRRSYEAQVLGRGGRDGLEQQEQVD